MCAKHTEIYKQYNIARIFLNKVGLEEIRKCYETIYKDNPAIEDCLLEEDLINIEVALIYYNIIIDLSWGLVYTSLKHTYFNKSENYFSSIPNHTTPEDANDILRTLEKYVEQPGQTEAYTFIKAIAPESYCAAITSMENFWNKFNNETEFRELYNYIKHRGKPHYSEDTQQIETGNYFKTTKKWTEDFHKRYLKGEVDQLIEEGFLVRQASKLQHVRRTESYKELQKQSLRFDNEMLFPHINDLIGKLYDALGGPVTILP